MKQVCGSRCIVFRWNKNVLYDILYSLIVPLKTLGVGDENILLELVGLDVGRFGGVRFQVFIVIIFFRKKWSKILPAVSKHLLLFA